MKSPPARACADRSPRTFWIRTASREAEHRLEHHLADALEPGVGSASPPRRAVAVGPMTAVHEGSTLYRRGLSALEYHFEEIERLQREGHNMYRRSYREWSRRNSSIVRVQVSGQRL